MGWWQQWTRSKNDFLILPREFVIKDVNLDSVGKPKAHREITHCELAQIYVLNKGACQDQAYAIKFALLRMEAIKCGWLENGATNEIIRKDDAPNFEVCRGVLKADLNNMKDHMALARTAAFIIPMVAEYIFRTMGHHYITNDAVSYTERYAATLRACLVPDVATYLPSAMLYHSALHWVNPGRAREVLGAQMNSKSIPDALRIRYNAPPAGTAVITTTAAVIKELSQIGLASQFEQYGGFNLQSIVNMTAEIKRDPPKYHKEYLAYNRPDFTQTEKENLEKVKEEACRFAPYAQAFITTHLRQTDLDKAKVLARHANQNPLAMRRAANFFRSSPWVSNYKKTLLLES